VRPEDEDAVLAFFGRQSDQSLRLRFHGIHHLTEEEAHRYTTVDYKDTYGLVVEVGDSVAGFAMYVRTESSCAEVGILVDDQVHGKGIGSLLIEQLTDAAASAGIPNMRADVLASNHEMLDVMRGLEFPVETTLDGDVLHLEFPTSPTAEAITAFEEREGVAAAAGVAAFLEPRSVAVIGASRRRGSIGGEIFRNLLEMSFEGAVYPVNPKAAAIQAVKAYASVDGIPEPVDLAVIVVPAASVLEAAEECGRAGVRALLVISAGFAETGPEGRKAEAALVEIAVRHGMRIVGPNCMGVMNLDPDVRLNATFSPITPPVGRLAFSSQSGALGIAVMGRAEELGLGLSSFVSVGNKADISGNDLLQYWERDEGTDVILLYLESFGNPRKFARVARRVSAKKPIVAVKSGRSTAGARAAASHTASLTSGDVAVDALFRKSGVIRTDTLEELFDVASLLSSQPLPKGKRVGILTNAGGLGILCADACEGAGLTVPALSGSTKESLANFLAAEASVGNPVDMIASASAEDYGRALSILDDAEEIDAVIVIFIPPLVTRAEDVAKAIMEAARRGKKTTLSCFLGVHGIHELLSDGETVIPSFAFPEPAARALARVVGYSGWRDAAVEEPPDLSGIDRAGSLALVSRLLADGDRWLLPHELAELLSLYGIESPRMEVVRDADSVGEAAARVAPRVAVKILSQEIQHKTDVGGVRLGIDATDASGAARDIEERLDEMGLGEKLEGFLVQEMVPTEGAEMFIGVSVDPAFGPLVTCGAGGVLVELLRDVSVRLAPLSRSDAKQMIRSLRSYPLLQGYRGSPALDESALEDVLLRVSEMVEDLPQIAELDLNPVIVRAAGGGVAVLDARLRLAAPAPKGPRGARRTGSLQDFPQS
jgi:acetyl coenzyme A synthetase (ADP forming)-like protein